MSRNHMFQDTHGWEGARMGDGCCLCSLLGHCGLQDVEPVNEPSLMALVQEGSSEVLVNTHLVMFDQQLHTHW